MSAQRPRPSDNEILAWMERHHIQNTGLFDVRAAFEDAQALWPDDMGEPEHLGDAAAELIAAVEGSIAEIVRLRDVMFRVYATAANGGDVTPRIEDMRDEMEKPWSVDRTRAALAAVRGGAA